MKPTDAEPHAAIEQASSLAEVTLPPDAETDELVASLRTLARYDDLGLLGEGGLGEVRRVHDRELDRVVAMKILRDDVVSSPAVLARFLEEARLSARLQHPGIVPVHDVGRRPDGRLFFTMQVVEGRTFREVVREWHVAARAGQEVRWRSLVEPFARVCEAVAYAHGAGVLHRDLKPSNVMLGVHGRVLVLDWGLALAQGQTSGHRVVGTPAYMPPEQAVGDESQLLPAADVWSLGAMLVEVLTGAPPWGSAGRAEILPALQRGEGPLPRKGRPGPPEPLWTLALDCLRLVPEDRPADASVVGGRVRDWLDGVAQRARGRELVLRARALDESVREQQKRARALRSQLAAAQREVPENAPLERKRPWWTLEDQARTLERAVVVGEGERDQLLQAALHLAPDLPEAHAALADGHHRRHLQAEARGDDAEATVLEGLLRHHDTQRHFTAYLRGEGRLRVRADAADAQAVLSRYQFVDRRLVPQVVDRFPLPVDRALPHGSWLLEVTAPGRVPARVPVWLGRQDVWDDEVHLLSALEPGCCYVPAGPFWTGGDPDVPCLPRRRLWAAGFVLDQHPVTNARYLAFLDDLVAQGREDEALRHAPRERPGAAGEEGRLIVGRTASGGFCLRADADGDEWRPDLPVLMVDWFAAMAFADWQAARTGLPWRLPTEFEWEKAARGVDGRRYPWGDHPDATWMCVRTSHEGPAAPPAVGTWPLDESPYGVRWMAGGVRDLCLDEAREDGPPTDGDRIVIPGPPFDPEVARVYRGGDWYGLAVHARAAYRAWNKPRTKNYSMGFRLCRST